MWSFKAAVAGDFARLLAIAAFSIATSAPTLAVAADAPPHPREVNITTDSAPGWLPSSELEEQARKTLRAFLAALDEGRAKEAYALLSDMNQKDETREAFTKRVAQFNAKSGASIERRVTKLTWTKDPASAPVPGVYAAFDLTSRFALIDRHCGYIVLYQPSSGGDFRVSRQEDNFIDNASAVQIERSQSKATLDELWSRLSARCPNYESDPVLAAITKGPGTPLPEQSGASIGYTTVAAALEDLKSKPGVVVSEQGGWTIANEKATMTLWSFAPAGYPAYPAVVRRQVVQEGDFVRVKMNVQCEASKAACDDLVREFVKLNAALERSLQGRR